MSYLIKVYHSFEQGKSSFQTFLQDLYKMLKRSFTLGLHYSKGEIFYSLDIEKKGYPVFESQFYSNFNDFQIAPIGKSYEKFNKKTSVLGEITLDNKGTFPFKTDGEGDIISSLFRSFENLNVSKDRVGLYFEFTATKTDGLNFWIASRWANRSLKRKLAFQFYKYLFSPKVQPGRKTIGSKYFYEKVKKNLFATKIYLVVSSDDKEQAEGKMKAIFNNFKVFSKFPFNKFVLNVHKTLPTLGNTDKIDTSGLSKIQLTIEEIALLFHFPKNPKAETSLLTVKSKKLALPVMIPSFDYTLQENGEVLPQDYPSDVNIVGISDYRSITVPIGVYDEDRLRHVYVVGKTGTGKSKFLLSLMINDVQQGKGI
ncbi:MAG: hypothetical protein LBP53_07245 [Candidatus Peribacteria bacterium]|jgi:hypothetical protein|nr:hypothetical protein [Candidatus Peribacteria bacterium]